VTAPERTDAPDRTSPSIRVFGGVSVDGSDGPVDIGGPRQRRLLALLAIRSGSLVDVDWLAEYLWDEDERPEAPTPSLRTSVHRLRSALPTAARAWIETEPQGYRLAAPEDAVEHRSGG
jgi:DNA-binding SARP family transcriptional activator